MQTNEVLRVVATDAALSLIRDVKAEYGDVLFHLSGGCCDGSVPLCYEAADFKVGVNDVLLGHVGDVPFYMHHNQYDYYKHAQIVLDAKDGHGSEFSLEFGCGRGFVMELRLFSDDELARLPALA